MSDVGPILCALRNIGIECAGYTHPRVGVIRISVGYYATKNSSGTSAPLEKAWFREAKPPPGSASVNPRSLHVN